MLLLTAYAALPRIVDISPAWKGILPTIPYLTIAFGMFLSLHFHRGRVFFILLMQALFYWCCDTYFRGGLDGFPSRLMYQMFFVLLPLNITLFCFMRERGVLTLGGRLRLLFLVAQGGVAYMLIRYECTGVERVLTRRYLTGSLFDQLPLPQTSMFVFLVGALLILIRILVRKSYIDSGMLGVMAAVALIGVKQAAPDAPLVFITTGALLLVLSILKDTYNMAYRDDLTGLQSRRALNEQLSGLGKRYTVAMVDIDHFKRFNDTFGHDVGDQVLRMVASRLERVSGGGRPFRYGGEEFTILFPRKKGAEVLTHLEDLRKSIAGYKLWLRSPDRPKKRAEGEKQRRSKEGEVSVSVTVSIGVADSNDGHTPSEVISSADKALYRAKHKGRNQVCR